MGGTFDIKSFLNGWYSEDLYFNNPPDYLAKLQRRLALQPHPHGAFDRRVGHVLGERTRWLAIMCCAQGIRHEMYVWGDQSYHDWPWWWPMARAYLCKGKRQPAAEQPQTKATTLPLSSRPERSGRDLQCAGLSTATNCSPPTSNRKQKHHSPLCHPDRSEA